MGADGSITGWINDASNCTGAQWYVSFGWPGVVAVPPPGVTGGHFVSFGNNGTTGGTLQQTFDSVAGQTYKVDLNSGQWPITAAAYQFLGEEVSRHLPGARSHVGGTEPLDDKSKMIPPDASRVNINDEDEVRYWCRVFGCTSDRLRSAVANVGAVASDVEHELKRR